LLRRPKHKASLNAAWHVTDAAVLSATLLYVGPWVDANRAGTMSGVPANGYTIVNLASSYDLGQGLSAYARIDNLFDRRYQDPVGFLRPGFWHIRRFAPRPRRAAFRALSNDPDRPDPIRAAVHVLTSKRKH
jgi:outer membrane receptor protein involved in Fe transport